MTHSVYELHVRLRDIEPPIWRTLEIPGSATLEDVHYAIQVAMGWQNSHLHQFTIGKHRYGMVHLDEVDELGDLEDERAHLLQDVARRGAVFLYEYDFGDSWEHDVKVQRVSSAAERVAPRCLGGERACPPEDCGGAPGYANLLEALADPNHEEHASVVEWVPKRFDPERYRVNTKDMSRVMAELKRLAEEGDDDFDGPDEVDADTSLPPALVASALGLPPVQRAELVALLAGSLAHQLTSAADRMEQMARAGANAGKAAKKEATTGPRRPAGERGR
ncbi:MAG: plasmid pRiA4b ORF-3 family protein [Polyangiaceae bacterium]|nr:plasmid pRiA4b ORF-3 family protein [Polyangiaceae bacterium]